MQPDWILAPTKFMPLSLPIAMTNQCDALAHLRMN
jgi:hypothetical protein